ncbi:MAG: hypothetical protein M2R45_00774 [Verrucomicrobia subdivision 3 bacterium]|nr:hypothetical protein [Limisphaerales bacterium]MCS1413120.1 hypothetical protein [Limisphaerales bacterium]
MNPRTVFAFFLPLIVIVVLVWIGCRDADYRNVGLVEERLSVGNAESESREHTTQALWIKPPPPRHISEVVAERECLVREHPHAYYNPPKRG